MSTIRVIIALALAVVALSGLTFTKAKEEGRLRADIGALTACQTAVTTTDLSSSALKCPPAVAGVHAAAQRAAICDQALLAGELFVIRSACSTEVKTLFSQREAESRRADSLAETLKTERNARAADIARAEARVRTETERKIRAEAALAAAPRNGDRLVLDAGRLCQLRGEDAACAAD